MKNRQSPRLMAFHPPKWLLVSVGPGDWITLTSALFAIFAALAATDAMSCRVELRSDHLLLVSNFKRRQFPCNAFVRVIGEKGVPVALQTITGEWVRFPSVLPGGPSVAGIVRNWIARK